MLFNSYPSLYRGLCLAKRTALLALAFLSLWCGHGGGVGASAGLLEPSPSYCLPPKVSVPKPPAGWQVIHSQLFIASASRLRQTEGPCWIPDDATYVCSLNQVTIPWLFDSNPSSLELGRVYRVRAVEDENVLQGNCFRGQLTASGFSTAHQNGQSVGQAYIGPGKLLTLNSTASQAANLTLYRSFNSDAPMGTGQAFLSGMFQPSVGPGPVELLDWFTVDQEYDFLIPNSALCPRLAEIETSAKASSAYKAHLSNVTQKLLSDIAIATSLPPVAVDIGRIKECVIAHGCNGYTIPDTMTESLIQRIFDEELWYYSFLYDYENYPMLAAGNLVSQILDQTEAIVAGKPAYKFMLYAVPSDGAVLQLLGALKLLPAVHLPPVGSGIAIELLTKHSRGTWDADTVSVRLVYNNVPMTIPGCPVSSEHLCPYSTFRTIATAVIPGYADCAGADTETDPFGSLRSH